MAAIFLGKSEKRFALPACSFLLASSVGLFYLTLDNVLQPITYRLDFTVLSEQVIKKNKMTINRFAWLFAQKLRTM